MGGAVLLTTKASIWPALYLFLIGVGCLLLWAYLLFQRITITEDLVMRKSIFGVTTIRIAEIFDARLGNIGRGNTALTIHSKSGNYKMGMAFPDETIVEMVALINLRRRSLIK